MSISWQWRWHLSLWLKDLKKGCLCLWADFVTELRVLWRPVVWRTTYNCIDSLGWFVAQGCSSNSLHSSKELVSWHLFIAVRFYGNPFDDKVLWTDTFFSNNNKSWLTFPLCQMCKLSVNSWISFIFSNLIIVSSNFG